MYELKVFSNEEFGQVRTLIVNGEPYFIGKDVAEKLGYKNTSDALVKHVDEDDKMQIAKHDLKNQDDIGTKGAQIINESGLYSLVLGSKLPSAKKFKRWVTSEVLPSIRKYGAYMTESTIEKALNSPDFLIQLATKLKEEQEARKALEVKVEEQKPLVEFANRVGNSSDCIDIGEMAKLIKNEDINIGRNRLFQWLRDSKILMSNNLPYQTYIDRGYFEVVEVVKNTPYGDKIFTKTLVTGKGQIWIVEKLKDELNNDKLMEA